jgi:hypothetical protein
VIEEQAERRETRFSHELRNRLDKTAWKTGCPQDPFFLRSAQRFFIARDRRFLPSGVMPPRFVSCGATGG